MKFEFIVEKMAVFSIRAMCRALRVSSSGYYAWRGRPKSSRDVDNEKLVAEIELAHRRSRGTYGSPRITVELNERGHCVSKKRVAQQMRKHSIRGSKRRRFRATTDSNHGFRVAPNLLKRDFERSEPNEAWVADVTALWTASGWLYLAMVVDLFSRTAVGWSTSPNNDSALALAALDDAVVTRKPGEGLIHHTDRGSPYASRDYRDRLEHYGMIPSMSRTGDCWDNAVAESFFATLKGEELDHHWFESHAAARAAIDDYINNFYNPLRRHSTLGYISPDEFELRAQLSALAA
ncbi:MAG: IS3 family transposase [Polyangiaceae bacterium]|nr:IS3 family transposase [Polyangiaceae bacterium]